MDKLGFDMKKKIYEAPKADKPVLIAGVLMINDSTKGFGKSEDDEEVDEDEWLIDDHRGSWERIWDEM